MTAYFQSETETITHSPLLSLPLLLPPLPADILDAFAYKPGLCVGIGKGEKVELHPFSSPPLQSISFKGTLSQVFTGTLKLLSNRQENIPPFNRALQKGLRLLTESCLAIISGMEINIWTGVYSRWKHYPVSTEQLQSFFQQFLLLPTPWCAYYCWIILIYTCRGRYPIVNWNSFEVNAATPIKSSWGNSP